MTVIRGNCFTEAPRIHPNESIPLIITDPPYGNIVNTKWDKEWDIDDQWKLTDLIATLLIPGGTAYVWGGIGKPKNRIFFQWLSLLEKIHSDLILWDVITWSKKRAYGTDKRYLFTREECAMITKGKPLIFNIPLLDEKRGYDGYNPDYPAKSEYKRRTNVWTDITELFKNKIHPCEKPSILAEIMIKTSSNVGDEVVDFFAGSGSTGVAAKKLKRNYTLYEISNCEMRINE